MSPTPRISAWTRTFRQLFMVRIGRRTQRTSQRFWDLRTDFFQKNLLLWGDRRMEIKLHRSPRSCCRLREQGDTLPLPQIYRETVRRHKIGIHVGVRDLTLCRSFRLEIKKKCTPTHNHPGFVSNFQNSNFESNSPPRTLSLCLPAPDNRMDVCRSSHAMRFTPAIRTGWERRKYAFQL